MADKGEPKADEEYVFEVPDFDEDDFIHREMVSFRTTLILFAWGVIAAAVSWLTWNAMEGAQTGWYVGLLIAAGFGFALKFIFPALKADVSHFGRREWMGTGFLFFFSWLAIFLLLSNPPISDHAPPTVEVFANPAVQQSGGDITIEAFFVDNDRITERTLTIRQGENLVPIELEKASGPGHYAATLTNLQGGVYDITASAKDAKGHSTSERTSFTVSSRTMRVEIPDGDLFDSALDTMLVTLNGAAEIRTVYLDLEHSEEHLHLEFDETLGGWKATAQFAGWKTGNNTFQVVASPRNIDFGPYLIEAAPIVHPDTFEITMDMPVGEHVVKVDAPVTVPENQRNTPGVGVIAMAAGLIGAAMVARRKQD